MCVRAVSAGVRARLAGEWQARLDLYRMRARRVSYARASPDGPWGKPRALYVITQSAYGTFNYAAHHTVIR